jgi:hypothetical protein
LFSVLGLVATATAQAATAAPATVPTEKLICKRIEEASTGSRLGKSKRICRTQTEWSAADLETARSLNKVKTTGMVDPDSLPKGR